MPVRGTGLLTDCQAEVILSNLLLIISEIYNFAIRVITEIVGL